MTPEEYTQSKVEEFNKEFVYDGELKPYPTISKGEFLFRGNLPASIRLFFKQALNVWPQEKMGILEISNLNEFVPSIIGALPDLKALNIRYLKDHVIYILE